MQAAPELSGRRLALLIATSAYSDPDLRQLRAPGRDASELAAALGDPHIGGFDVRVELNASSVDIHEKAEDFCADRHPDDQLLIYLSCHGVLDGNGRLYYAATNTRRQRLAATAVAAGWLNERLDDCRARRQMLILDCCHSGAFARGAKGLDDLALQQRFEPQGRGRVVLTASRNTEYSFEGAQASGEGLPSVFTHAIVNGLRTGEADRDEDGLITVSDLYRYVYDSVRAIEPRQTPELWTYGAEGDLVVAHSIRGAIEPEPLPEDLRIALQSPRPRVREIAVMELAELLDKASPGLAVTARQNLRKVAESDIPPVAELARVALTAPRTTAAGQVHRAIAERSRRNQETPHEAKEQAARQTEDLTGREGRIQASGGGHGNTQGQQGSDAGASVRGEKAEHYQPAYSRPFRRPLIYSGLILLLLVSVLSLFVSAAAIIYVADTNLRIEKGSSAIGTGSGIASVISWSVTIAIGRWWARLYRRWRCRHRAKPSMRTTIVSVAVIVTLIVGAFVAAAVVEGML